MGELEPGRGDRRGAATFVVFVVLLTLLVVAASYAPHTWINRDGRFYTNVNVTLVESLSLDQSEFCSSWYEPVDDPAAWNYDLDAAFSNVAVGRGDTRLPKHPVLMPVLATPLFWAFGLPGTLLFNLAAFALAAAAVFLFTRRYASPAAATVAALTFVFGTSVQGHAYDYHVDVLLLALFASGVAALHGKRGALAGLLVGGAVVLKPTMLLFLPSLLVLASTREGWPALRRSLAAGAGVLLLFGLFNWWLFGKPWWSGYNRVLVLVGGVPEVLDVGGTFDVPFAAGFETLWAGPEGVRTRLLAMLAALPGLLWMARRRPRYVAAAALAVGLSVAVFSRYQWYSDRFLWPAFALLAPSLGVGLDAAGRILRTAFRLRPSWQPSLVVSVGAMVILGAGLAMGEGLPEGEARGATLFRVVLVALLVFSSLRLAERLSPGPASWATPLALVLFPGLAERLFSGGPELPIATLVVGGLALAAHGHWRSAGVVSALSAWTALAPLPIALGVLVLAPRGRPRAGAALAIGAVAAAAGLTALISGSPSTRVHDALVFTDGSPGDLAVPLRATWAALSNGPGLAWLGLILVGVWGLARSKLGVVVGLCMVAALWPSARAAAPVPLFVLALASLGWPAVIDRLGEALEGLAERSAGRRMQLLGAALVALFVIGGATRVAAAGSPATLASYRGLRRAEVFLAGTPCDFLNWHHMNWECAALDEDAQHMVGLDVTNGLWVGGVRRELLRIPNADHANRRVRWPGLVATRRLQLKWAVPDDVGGARGAAATLVVRIEGEEAARFVVPPGPSGQVQTESISSGVHAGNAVAVEIELLGPGATVAVDGEFLE